jgi:hypothetical protein
VTKGTREVRANISHRANFQRGEDTEEFYHRDTENTKGREEMAASYKIFTLSIRPLTLTCRVAFSDFKPPDCGLLLEPARRRRSRNPQKKNILQ